MALLSPPDDSDMFYEDLASAPKGFYLAQLPKSYSLRNSSLIPRNQGERPTCVAFAVAVLYQVYNNSQLQFSPEWVYQHRINRTTAGMYAKDALKIIQNTGIVLEDDYPYNGSEIPHIDLYDEAMHNRITSFSKVSTQDGVKRALLETKIPLVALIKHYEGNSKFWKKTLLTKPRTSFHAVLITGYNHDGLEIMNSWGEDWESKGFSTIPWKYWKRIKEIWSAQ